MFDKLAAISEGARERVAAWNRDRKDATAMKEAARQLRADPATVTVPASLVRSAHLAAWMAYLCLVYFLWIYTLDIARDRSASLHLTHVGGWIGDIQFYFPYIVGFAVVAIGIPYVAKIAIPTFMSLHWADNAWAKGWALFIAVAVSFVVIAGTFTVQGDTILERDRESVVAVDQVAQEAAVQQARIDDVQHRLDEMTRSPSIYVQTAASMSPAAYEAWMEARRSDWQYERFVAYRQTSIDAQNLRDQISAMREAQARSTVTSAVEARVTTAETGWIAATLGWLEGARAMLLSFVMDIVCLIMPWIALRLEQARNRQLGLHGDATQSRWDLLADMRAEPPIPSGAYVRETQIRERKPDGTEEVVCDEDGTPMQRVEYYRRTDGKPLMKNQKSQVQVTPPHMKDEVGVPVDGAEMSRIASARDQGEENEAEYNSGGEAKNGSIESKTGHDESPKVEEAEPQTEDGKRQEGGDDNGAYDVHPETPISEAYTPDELDAMIAEDAGSIESEPLPPAPDSEPQDEASGEAEDEGDHDAPPQQDEHVKARALIAAE